MRCTTNAAACTGSGVLEGSLGDAISTSHAMATGLAYGAVLLAATFAITLRRLLV
jgi:hypothetical protein